MEIRNTWHCVNLLKVFKDNLPPQKNYKLASIEKLYNLKRNRNEYKTNIFSIFQDWRKPQVRSLVLQYNREDVLNLMRLKHIIFWQYDVDPEYLLQVRLAGAHGITKNYVYLLPCDLYRGALYGRKKNGTGEGNPNITAQMVIGAKFFNDKVSLYRMIVLMHDVVRNMDFDVITAVNGRDSAFHLAGALAKGIAARKKQEYNPVLSDGNTRCSPDVKGLKVLIVDDVIYKGRTMDAAIKACLEQRPASVYFLAFGKSSRFAY